MQRDILAQIQPLLTATVFAMGTIVGSFLNVVVWRLPRGESLVHPGSHCPACNHPIKPWENVPILSWIFLRAKCSQCGCPISIRYPLLELATGLVFLALWWRVWSGDLPLSTAWGYFVLGSALLAASLIDLEHTIIPDSITVTGIVAAFALAAVWPQSHLQQNLSGTAEGSHIILDWVVNSTRGLADALWSRPRARAAADVALGAAFGYGMLWALLQAGKCLWGTLKITPKNTVQARLDPHTLRIEDMFTETWNELFFRKRDRFLGDAVRVTVVPAGGETPPVKDEPGVVMASRTGITIGEKHWDWDAVKCVEATLRSFVLPREVMGYGDLKLLAMIGAFLGADATIFVLMIAAAVGCLIGTAHIALRPRHRHSPIPFGPFLAASALAWILTGDALLSWYVRHLL